MTKRLPNRLSVVTEGVAGAGALQYKQFERVRRTTQKVEGVRIELVFLRCLRKDCGKIFAVQPKPFKSTRRWRGQTRPCPYCFRVSRV